MCCPNPKWANFCGERSAVKNKNAKKLSPKYLSCTIQYIVPAFPVHLKLRIIN